MDLSPLDLNTLGALASIAGLLPSFVQWFTSEYRARRSKRKEKAKDIIEHYIEWLRRQRHDELLSKLSGSQQALSELHNLVKQLMTMSKEARVAVLTRLDSMDAGLHKRFDVIDSKLEHLTEGGLRSKKDEKALWPGISLPKDGPRVIVPFGGRVEELKDLKKAMRSKHPVVAVVGMAGQGKSCLTGEWYNRKARPPEGLGLIWRKVYESGFTFDLFLDELHVYLTGEHINRQEITSTEARSAVLQDILAKKPCWIVLDGAERWLKLWAVKPDADAAEASADERAGAEPALDTFLKRASFWENGSKLLLTTRAVPSALDNNPPIRIGRKPKAVKKGKEQTDKQDQPLLEDLKPGEAIELLEKLGVHGDKNTKLQAAEAYGNHAYAVHVLGLLIHESYDGDVSKWQDVEPLKEKKKNRDVGGLFERIISNRKEDFGLLEYVAASVGPAPVAMLASLPGADEQDIRKRLVELARWQMVEFQRGEHADQHTVVRKVMSAKMGRQRVRELQKQIALWWAGREVPERPEKIEDIRPLIKAIEHLIAARDPDAATDIFLTKLTPESNYILNEWLDRFGYMDDSIRLHGELIRVYEELIEKESRRELRNDLARCYNNRGGAFKNQGKLTEAIDDYVRAIKIYKELVEKESRRELRNDLARCYNNRGLALANQGKLKEAIDDYGRAIEIRERLVEKESRRELRNDLASCYNNRGGALFRQGKLDEAIDDYGRAIEIREQLVEKESRRELRSDLESCLFNRAVAFSQRKEWKPASADIDKGGGLLRELIEEGRRHVIGSFLKAAGFRCAFAKELGGERQAAAWANDGMRWFIAEAQAGRMNELLVRDAAGFAQRLMGNIKVVSAGGLDEELAERFLGLLKDLTPD